ncbi:MAG: hypothetical protein JO254_05340 [Pseudolabrys sp.]|nr:hypothetical protein [Pseudolabrys sp.]
MPTELPLHPAKPPPAERGVPWLFVVILVLGSALAFLSQMHDPTPAYALAASPQELQLSP